MNKKSYFFITLLILAIAISACAKQESAPVTVFTYDEAEISAGFEMGEPDKSFITGKPCEAPCFQNIELLATTGEEALAILETLPFINTESIINEENFYEEGTYFLKYACSDNTTEQCGYVGVSSYELVTGIGNQIFYRLSLAEVIEKYGQPNFSYRNSAYGGEDVCEVVVYFVDQNFAVEILEEGDRGVCQNFTETEKLSGDLQIDWVYFNFIDAEIAENMIEWQGLKK